MRSILLMGWLLSLAAAPAIAEGQSSSLFQRDLPRTSAGLNTLENSSFIYRPITPPPEIKVHDLITVIVDEKSSVFSEGEIDREKKNRIDAVLNDSVVLDNFNLKPSPQSDGDPRFKGSFNTKNEADAEMETRDGMKFTIACEVVDIRPNGTLVLEGHRQIRNNEEAWEQSLTGLVNPAAVKEGGLVLSKDVAELNIFKRERGEVRDGYRRGWLQKIYDRVQPF